MILALLIPLPPLLCFEICSLILVAVHVDCRLVLAVGLLWWTWQCADHVTGSRDEAFDFSNLGCQGYLIVLVVILLRKVSCLAMPLSLLPALLTCHQEAIAELIAIHRAILAGLVYYLRHLYLWRLGTIIPTTHVDWGDEVNVVVDISSYSILECAYCLILHESPCVYCFKISISYFST